MNWTFWVQTGHAHRSGFVSAVQIMCGAHEAQQRKRLHRHSYEVFKTISCGRYQSQNFTMLTVYNTSISSPLCFDLDRILITPAELLYSKRFWGLEGTSGEFKQYISRFITLIAHAYISC